MNRHKYRTFRIVCGWCSEAPLKAYELRQAREPSGIYEAVAHFASDELCMKFLAANGADLEDVERWPHVVCINPAHVDPWNKTHLARRYWFKENCYE